MDRRDFGGALGLSGLVASLTSAQRLAARVPADVAPENPSRPVVLGLIGVGLWGQAIARSLADVTNVTLRTVCDSAAVEKARAAAVAPSAGFVDDYRLVLDDKAIEAVVIATPTHRHKAIVLDAIAAGKHVYCEAPLAVTTEDLIAICRAARDARVVFQPGLQRRCHPISIRVKRAALDGSVQQVVLLNSHARQRTNWMRAAATPQRAKERSWQAYRESSLGPVGELGIHQIDMANYWLGGKPTSVRGYGVQTTWAESGMEVPDTTVCELTYPTGVRASIESSIASSHWGRWEELVGTEGTVLCRDNEGATPAYLFKEPGASRVGWEVTQRRTAILDEPGLTMTATAQPEGPVDEGPLPSPLRYALGSFARRVETSEAPLVGWQKAFEANLIAIRAAQALREGTTIAFTRADLALT